ncbi:MAG: type II secretion system F family protein [Candidatus Cloacimonadaceae bacterium]|nr:type II secretion system F family protein [Candidatus Cloacimonadota bacterium]MDY0126746.1 type II secretion system F family protein [Candidatus Cloacimonadaceae bacterium]MCB5255671.1 type II secretion system F family protein [Candidatus Cloacimonadota bacterium]MCK9178337.1 type II secretion system F family protein [Candidatus Cloacimonadota bacterium]MCK9241914.1 type II secretion system F family protein [Candidatus Cloacimonadota bacterium]
MTKEYRFKGISPDAKLVQGTFLADSNKAAKQQLAKVELRYKLKIQAFERKRDWLYKVYVPGKKAVSGRQSAYSKEEVANALRKMGYTKFKISPVLFDIPSKPSLADIMMFIKLSATMLRDKMSFGKILEMLAEEQPNRGFRDALQQIESQLKSGAEGREVFMRFEHIFGKFPAYMLGLATRSGNMAEVFDATAKFIERDMEIKKNVKKALISPMFALLATFGAMIYYIVAIFPATAQMFLKYDMPLPPLTEKTLAASDWLSVYWWVLLLAVAVPMFVIWRWWQTPKGKIWRDKRIIKLPIVGHLLHKSAIEIYFRVFGTIYGGAGDNIETIKTSAEACRNAWMEERIKQVTIPLMLKDGLGFVEAMTAAEVFTRTALTRIRTGQETGTILQSAQQIATFYEAETSYKMNNLVEYIQTIVGLVVAIAITFLTVVSAEIATISPPTM